MGRDTSCQLVWHRPMLHCCTLLMPTHVPTPRPGPCAADDLRAAELLVGLVGLVAGGDGTGGGSGPGSAHLAAGLAAGVPAVPAVPAAPAEGHASLDVAVLHAVGGDAAAHGAGAVASEGGRVPISTEGSIALMTQVRPTSSSRFPQLPARQRAEVWPCQQLAGELHCLPRPCRLQAAGVITRLQGSLRAAQEQVGGQGWAARWRAQDLNACFVWGSRFAGPSPAVH